MIIDVKNQIEKDSSFPLDPLRVYSGFALPLTVVNVPKFRGNCQIKSLSATIVNADGLTATVPMEINKKGYWSCVFPASNFLNYGYVSNAVSIVAEIVDKNDQSYTDVIARGDLEVLPANAEANPGDPGKHYQTAGGDIYVKSEIIDGVQHYKRLSIAYNSRLGVWGFNDPAGDYVLDANGNFIAISR